MAKIIKYSDHKVIRLRQNSHIQRMTIGDSWRKITIGILCKFYIETIPASNTTLGEQGVHFGFCSGPGTGRDSYPSASVNFVGLKLVGNSLFQTASDNSYSSVHMHYFYGSKFQGASETATVAFTDGSGGDVPINLKYSGYYSIIGAQIDRDAETINCFSPLSTAYNPYFLTSSNTDKSTFRWVVRQDMVKVTLPNSSISALVKWSTNGPLSLAMPSGLLDHVCVYKAFSNCALDIAAISVHRLA